MIKDRYEEKARNFETAMSDIRTKIKNDVGQGKDIDGNQFAEYTPRYKKWREANNKRGTPPDLRLTGNMMDSLNVNFDRFPDKLVARLGFLGETEKVIGNLKKRKFFGFNQKMREYVLKRVKGK